MDPKKLMKQMFDFNRTAFEKTFSNMVIIQDQAEKMSNMWLEKNQWFPEEGKKAMGEWVQTCKKGRDEFKAKIDEGYDKIDEYFTAPEE